jgi:hypothetical protein
MPGRCDVRLSFHLERHDDSGMPLPPVPVVFSGTSPDGVCFDGEIHEGDHVVITGPWKPGQTLRPSQVYNVSTGTNVRAPGYVTGRAGAVVSGAFLALRLIWIGMVLFIGWMVLVHR